MNKTSMKAICLVLLTSVAAGYAGVLSFNGDTTGQPTWNRPVGGNPPTPPTSGVGTAVPYQVTQLYVTAPGTYTFYSTGVTPPAWDNYSFLYANSFNPVDQFANVLIGNDDFNSNIGQSGFDYALVTGTQYYFVESGFANTDFGVYGVEIRGPGDIVMVPEPGQVAMMMLTGLGVVGYAGRNWLRRRQA